MFQINLKDNKTFQCSQDETLIDGAKKVGIILQHSCLTGRCSSCKVLVKSGLSESKTFELGLNSSDKEKGYILSCVRKPKSDMYIQAEDLSDYGINNSKTIPAKISLIELVTEDILKVTLRFPPNQSLEFISGQYADIIKGGIKRSYSIANNDSSCLEFFIKKYPGGVLSNYWFNEAKINDLLRVEGPKGTFFLRKISNYKNIIFMATGTGIAPIKSILESISNTPEKFNNVNLYLFWGAKYFKDLFWNPDILGLNINYFPVLSVEKKVSTEIGHIQEALLRNNIALNESVVYACGSEKMINDSQMLLTQNGLQSESFYSDAFVSSIN